MDIRMSYFTALLIENVLFFIQYFFSLTKTPKQICTYLSMSAIQQII